MTHEVVKEFADRGVELLAVNLEEQAEQVKSILERHKLKIPVALDRDGVVAAKFAVTAIPQTVVIEQAPAPAQVIKIESPSPQVVYVPAYDPVKVYGTWPYPTYPPPPYYPPYPPGYVASSVISFGVGVACGVGLHPDRLLIRQGHGAGIVEAANTAQSAEHVVERAILLHQDHDMLGVEKRSVIAGVDGCGALDGH